MLRKALLILSGNATTSLFLLIRNLLIARMIPVEDYGVAATFAMAMAVVEMASAFGLQQQIVQSKQGENPHFQSALQGFHALRGCISAAVLFFLADHIAVFLNIADVGWAYKVLALIPLMNGFQHFDIYRHTRSMRFAPLILTGSLPALLTLLVTWPLVHVFGDWRVMLYALIFQSFLELTTSHIIAERRYRIVLDREILGQSLRFGWPLLINAGLMFLVFQGDKLIVARVLGMESLAIFAMGMTLSLTPTLVMAKSAQNLFLPKLSAAVGTAAFDRYKRMTLNVLLLGTLVFVAAVILLGPWLIEVVLGQKYLVLVQILVWFALAQAFRLLKSGPALVSLSLGYTGNSAIANFVRVLFLPLAWFSAVQAGEITGILLIALLGEGLSLFVAFALLARRVRLADRAIIIPHMVGLGALCLMSVLVFFMHGSSVVFWTEAVAFTAIVLCVIAMPEIKAIFRRR